MMNLHDPIDTFVVHSGLSLFTKHPVEQGSDPPVSIGGAVVSNHPDDGEVSCIIRSYLVPSGSCWLFVEV